MMWVRKTQSGTYQFSERYKDPMTGKYKEVSVTYKTKNRITRKQAQMVLEEKIQERLRHVQDGNIKHGVTLGEVIKEWEPIYHEQVRDTTWQTYIVSKKHINKYIGFDTQVDKITPKFLINAYETMLYHDGYNNPTVKIVSFRMNSILRFAYKRDYIANQPVKELDVNWKKNAPKQVDQKFLEDDELHRVLNYVYSKDEQQGAIFEWQYLTGMRIGEVLGMQVRNIFQQHGKYYAKVTGTLEYTGNKTSDYYKQPTPKTSNSFRTILLPQEAIEIYQRWSINKKPNDYLFFIDNKFFSFTLLNQRLRNAKRDLHINKPLTTHIFRHTHVSKLAELGVPLYIIQNRLGHADSSTTRDVYLHVTEKAKQKYDDTIFTLK
ncbi:MAG TPA: site-specific integrase [Limosilactobacillus coleohominis]|nr:site-specific integrase [Limosilactobacillus coleohominis]